MTSTKEILDPQGREGETIEVAAFKVGDKVRLLEAGDASDVGTVTWYGAPDGIDPAIEIRWDWAGAPTGYYMAHQLARLDRPPIVLGGQVAVVARPDQPATVHHLAGGRGGEPVVGLHWGKGVTTKHHPDELVVISKGPTPNATRLEWRDGEWQIGRYGADTLETDGREDACTPCCECAGDDDALPGRPCGPCWGTGYTPPLFGYQVIDQDTGATLGPAFEEPECAAKALAVAQDLAKSLGLINLVGAAAPGGLRLSNWQRRRLDKAS